MRQHVVEGARRTGATPAISPTSLREAERSAASREHIQHRARTMRTSSGAWPSRQGDQVTFGSPAPMFGRLSRAAATAFRDTIGDDSDEEGMEVDDDAGLWMGGRAVSPPPNLPPTPPPRSRHSIGGPPDAFRLQSDASSSATTAAGMRAAGRRPSLGGLRTYTPPTGSAPRVDPALSPLNVEGAANTFRRTVGQRPSSPSPTRPDRRDSSVTEAFLRSADERRAQRARSGRPNSFSIDEEEFFWPDQLIEPSDGPFQRRFGAASRFLQSARPSAAESIPRPDTSAPAAHSLAARYSAAALGFNSLDFPWGLAAGGSGNRSSQDPVNPSSFMACSAIH